MTLAIIQICSSVFNIIVTIFLIKWKPLVGSSLGTALALIIGDVVLMDIVLHKEVGIRFGEYYRDLFKGTLPALLITFAFGVAFSLLHLNRYGWAGLIINCVITAAVYAALMAAFFMNSYEKGLLKGLFNKIIGKLGRKKA